MVSLLFTRFLVLLVCVFCLKCSTEFFRKVSGRVNGHLDLKLQVNESLLVAAGWDLTDIAVREIAAKCALSDQFKF